MGLASVMYGTTAADASSGYAINTLIQAAQSLFGPIAQHLAEGYAQLGKLALKNVELLGQRVYVYQKPSGKGWISLHPDDIGSYYNLRGLVQATLPQELPVNAQVAMQLTQGEHPLMDRALARGKLLKDPYPDRTERNIRRQTWADSPEVQQFYIQKALRDADMELEQMAPAQNPQGPLAPGLATAMGRPELAGPPSMAPGGLLGQGGIGMAPGVNMPSPPQPQTPPPQAQVNAAEATMNPLPGGRRAGAARSPGGARKGRGVVP